MKNTFMIGLWRYILKLPPFLWEKQVALATKKFEAENSFMSGEHRLVHHFVVKELPYAGKPLSPERIATTLGLALSHVNTILDDLETHLTFLFRNDTGNVVWAYPVTVEKTPHQVRFQTGEHVYAA